MTRTSELDRKRAQRAAAIAREEQRRAEHFAAATTNLVAVLPAKVERARERSQVALDLTIGAQCITIRRPISVPDRIDSPRLVLARPDREGTNLEVELIFDTRTGGEVPSGESVPVLSVRSSIEALLAGDLDILLEWLVSCSDRDHPAVPEIAGVFEQRREQEQEHEREEALQQQKKWLMIAGHTAALLVALGLKFWIFAPIGLGIGIWSRNRLEDLDSTAGLWSSGCFMLFAIAFSVLMSAFGIMMIINIAR